MKFHRLTGAIALCLAFLSILSNLDAQDFLSFDSRFDELQISDEAENFPVRLAALTIDVPPEDNVSARAIKFGSDSAQLIGDQVQATEIENRIASAQQKVVVGTIQAVAMVAFFGAACIGLLLYSNRNPHGRTRRFED